MTQAATSAPMKSRAQIIAPAVFAMATGIDGFFMPVGFGEITRAAEVIAEHADLAAPRAAFITERVRAGAEIRVANFAIRHREVTNDRLRVLGWVQIFEPAPSPSIEINPAPIQSSKPQSV